MPKDESVIPAGPYCYEFKKNLGPIGIETKVCPYWSINANEEPQLNGYCSFLGKGDWDTDGFGLLWDQVKACGINDD